MSPLRTARNLLALTTLTLVVGAAAGCGSSGDEQDPNLPAAATLLSQAATAMGTVQSVQFDLEVKGTLAELPISGAKGVLTHDGDAKGTANVAELGQTIQVSFVLVGQTFYLSTGTGGYTPMPLSAATQVFDPSAILDPNKGIPKILDTASNGKTVREETVGGVKCYKVVADIDQSAANYLIPGATKGTTADIWLDESTKRVIKAVFTVPQSSKPVTVTVTLTDYDKPVTINAP